MKKLLLPFLALFLFVACGEDALHQVDTPTIESQPFDINTFLASPEYEQLTPYLQDYLATVSDPGQSTTSQNAPREYEKGGVSTSNEPVNNLAEDQVTCLDVAGRSSIVRSPDGLRINYHAKGLVPGQEYLVYLLALNYDENCFPDFSGGFFSFADAITLARVKANPAGNLKLNTFHAAGDNTNSWYGFFGHGASDPMGSDLILYTRIGEPFEGGVDLQNSYHFLCTPLPECG